MQTPRADSFTADVSGVRLIDAWYSPGTSFDTHVHEENYACLVVEGAFVEWTPLAREVRAGMDQAWRAGSRHAVETGSDPVRIFHLAADDDGVLDHPLRSGLLWQLAIATASMAENGADPADRLHIECLASEFLDEQRAQRATEIRPAGAWLEDVRSRLRDGFGEPPSLDDLAIVAARSPSQVTRGFRGAFGMTPGEYLRRIRVAHAVRFLRSSDVPLSRVALQAGFADQSHMGRWIRRYLGTTPGDLRGE